MKRGLSAALLDIDGTLVDSNDAHAQAWVAAFAEHGVCVPLAQVRTAIGKGGDKLLPDLTGIPEQSRLGESISKARKRIFRREHLPRLKAFPGTKELVALLEDAGLRVAIATSAASDEVGALLEIAGVTHLYERAASADDVERSKPDPDVVGACLAKLSVIGTEALLLGDTPYDVLAGKRAGVGVVGVESGGWRAHALDGALIVYQDLTHLLSSFDTSPFVGSGIETTGLCVSQRPTERRVASA